MKKAFKIILVILTILFFVVTGVIAFFIHSLPSMKSVSQMLTTPKNSPANPSGSAGVLPAPHSSQITSMDSQSSAPSAASADSSLENQSNSTDSKISREGLESLTDPKGPLVDFCRHLAFSKSGAMEPAEFNKAFNASLSGESFDPRIQAMKPLLKSIFRQPKLQDLIQEAQAATANGEDNFWQKAAFYSKAAVAFQEMMSNKKNFEAIGDRTYLLLKLNDLVAKRPELSGDPRIQQFCELNETSLNQSENLSYETEKSNLLRLLAETGVSAQEIGFNPQYQTEFDILFDGKSLQLKGGWLEELIKPPTPKSEK